jgi:hypothetical protein
VGWSANTPRALAEARLLDESSALRPYAAEKQLAWELAMAKARTTRSRVPMR